MSPFDVNLFCTELERDDLSIFTAVRLARLDVASGDMEMAVARLRVDADKIRTVSNALFVLVTKGD